MSLIDIASKIKQFVIDDVGKINIGYNNTKPTVVIGDVYTVNENQTTMYPLIVISQKEHSMNVEKNYIYYNLVLFYIERLGDTIQYNRYQSDNCEFGLNEIPMSGVTRGTTIFFTLIKQLENTGYLISNINNITITPFTEKFNDVCCGCYINLQVREELTRCDIWFGQEPPEDPAVEAANISVASLSDFELDSGPGELS